MRTPLAVRSKGISMLRSILAVIAGYAVMFVLVMALHIGLMVAMPDVFSKNMQGPYEGPQWVLYFELVLSFVFAVTGGCVCTAIGGRRAALALALIMLVLGALTIFMEQGLKPMWSIVATTLAGPVGVLLGSRLRKDRRA